MTSASVRGLAALFAGSWLFFPGFGLVDLSVTWSPDWPVMLEAGWGLFFSVFVGLSFVIVGVRPRKGAAAIAQLFIAAASLAGAAVVSLELPGVVLAAVVAMQTVAVAQARGREPLLPPLLTFDRGLLLLAVVGAIPALAYGWEMSRRNRRELADRDITIGVDHYSVQAATAVAIVSLSFVAAAWPRGRRLIGSSVGLVVTYLGIVSAFWPGATGGFGAFWSVAAVGWGATFMLLAWLRAEGRQQSCAVWS